MRIGIWVAVVLAAMWPGLGHAAWREASSDHFVIYADDTERDITRFAQQLERYHAGMALALGSKAAAPSPSNRVTVYVVRSDREVRALHGGDNKYLNGFYIPRAGGSLAIVPAVNSGNGDITLSMVTLLHEYAHHFLISNNAMAMPRWFSEGAAEFFASARFEADGRLWLGRPAQHRAGELFYAKDVKAADLLDPTDYDKRKHSSYDAFYGKSWLLYHYLTFGKEREGQFDRYIALLRQGLGQREAALQAFGDFAVLERDLDRYLRSPRMLALELTPDRLRIGAVTLRTLSAGEAAMMPVTIRSERGVSQDEAKAQLIEARAIAANYPADPAVLSRLAECEYDAGNDKEAIAAADAALKIDPAQLNAYTQKGYALFRLAGETDDPEVAYKTARAPFIALNRIENDHPIPLLYFYRSFLAEGKAPSPLALHGLIRAVEVAPFDKGLRIELGWALIRLGRHDEARNVLSPVATDPHGGGTSRLARRMIDRMDKDAAWKGENFEPDESEEKEGELGG